MHLIIQWFIFAAAVLIASKVVPGIKVRSFGGALIFAAVFGLLDVTLYWLLAVLSIPFIIVTLGLGLLIVNLVINAILFMVADKFVESVEIDGFGSALLGSAVTSLVVWASHFVIR